VLQVEREAALDRVLDEVHERAREQAPVRRAARAPARRAREQPELARGRHVVRDRLHELEEHRRRRVHDRVQQRPRLCFALRRADVLRADRGERREPVEQDQAFPVSV
jgi:hypothetical protein